MTLIHPRAPADGPTLPTLRIKPLNAPCGAGRDLDVDLLNDRWALQYNTFCCSTSFSSIADTDFCHLVIINPWPHDNYRGKSPQG